MTKACLAPATARTAAVAVNRRLDTDPADEKSRWSEPAPASAPAHSLRGVAHTSVKSKPQAWQLIKNAFPDVFLSQEAQKGQTRDEPVPFQISQYVYQTWAPFIHS